MHQELYSQFSGNASPDDIWQMNAAIHDRDRWFDFEAFHQTASYVLEQLQALGLEAEIREYPADGRTLYGDWKMPLAWDVESACLRLLPSEDVLADYQQVPCSLCMWSAPTPEGGVQVPLVMV